MSRRLPPAPPRLTANDYRLAQRLIAKKNQHTLTAVDLRALHAVVLHYRDNSIIPDEELRHAKHILEHFRRKLFATS